MISDDLIKKVTGQYDVEIIQRLNLDNFGLKAMGNICRMENLKDLSLARNDIVDLSPLEPLCDLRRLILNENMIRSLAPLAHLEHLETLDISGNARLESLPAVLDVLKQMKSLRNLTLKAGDDSTPVTEYQKDLASGLYPQIIFEVLPNLQILDGSHVEVIQASLVKSPTKEKTIGNGLEEEKGDNDSAKNGSWIAPLLSSGEDFDGAVSPRSSALLGALEDRRKDAQELLRRADHATTSI
jgi:hypothetical protein